MKAILMLDEMPKECIECPCADYVLNMCRASLSSEEINTSGKPDWCPLIEINDNIAKLVEVAR